MTYNNNRYCSPAYVISNKRVFYNIKTDYFFDKNLYRSGKCCALLSEFNVVAVWPRFQCCSVTIGCPVYDFAVIKVDFMIMCPGMLFYVRAGFELFYVSFMFVFSRFESSAGPAYIAPGPVCAIDLIYDIGLFFGKWFVFW